MSQYQLFLGHISLKFCIQFWIGVWLRYEGVHSKQYDKAVEETGLERTTLQNIKNVAESISPSLRNERLSFNHHIAVAPLSAEEQKQWLEKAEEKNLSVRELRQEIKKTLSPLSLRNVRLFNYFLLSVSTISLPLRAFNSALNAKPYFFFNSNAVA